MLRMLSERQLPATWATVGAMSADGWDEYFRTAPAAPGYRNTRLRVTEQWSHADPAGTYHFCPELVGAVASDPLQELGSHSYSHVYFREPGVRGEDFLGDMRAVEDSFRAKFGTTPVSLVYPANQCAFEELLDQTSIRIWRASEPGWCHDATSEATNGALARACRLGEASSPWVRHASPPSAHALRASLFVRFGLPLPLWRLHMERLRSELAHLQHDQVFHCWWHEHNLGPDLRTGLSRLTEVLDTIAAAAATRNVRARSMNGFLASPPAA
jgi:peptidoglycan/xylan/chitin deacetylase (PgdA/CDA1 family)